MKKIFYLFLLITLVFTTTSCSAKAVTQVDTTVAQADITSDIVLITEEAQQSASVTYVPVSADFDEDDLESSLEGSEVSYITLEGDSISFEGSGAEVAGNVITITSAGTYSISGTLNDGQIRVDTQDSEKVVLVLNGASINNSSSSPIYVVSAEKTVITLYEGSQNYVSDGVNYVFEDSESDEPNAAIFSKDDLTINGDGSLTVTAKYNNGIVSKDALKITAGNITVTAVNDGLKGRDSVAIKDGTLTITTGADGVQANNDEDAEQGYISIEGGTLNIISGLDGIQAETSLLVSGGTLNIVSGGGSVNGEVHQEMGMGNRRDNQAVTTTEDETDSKKGLKAGVDVTITGGTIQIDAADDAIHSNDSLTIDGGNLTLLSGDDGLHSDSTLEINGGELRITKSYEGIESAVITINDGIIYVTASDDGTNAAGGVDGSGMGGGMNEFNSSMSYHTYINGGYIYVNAGGDGIDSNGPIDMSGGTVIVNGPTNSGNGPLDYTGNFTLTGGYLIAVGSSGMAQAPSTTSTQYSILQNYQTTQSAGTMVHIETQSGEELLSFVPAKEYQSVVFSSAELQNDQTIVICSGGSSSGTDTDGLYTGGEYSGGTQVASLTLNSVVTGAGASGGFPSGPGGNPGGQPGGQPGGCP